MYTESAASVCKIVTWVVIINVQDASKHNETSLTSARTFTFIRMNIRLDALKPPK
jgi:hypothetical protein